MPNKQWNLRTETEFIVESYSTYYILRHRGYVTYQFAVFSALIHLSHVCVCMRERVCIRVDSIYVYLFGVQVELFSRWSFCFCVRSRISAWNSLMHKPFCLNRLLVVATHQPSDRPSKRTNHCQFQVAHRRTKRSAYFTCIIFWRNMASAAFIASKCWII